MLKPWCDCISRQLISAQVYSQNETPHVVEFNFEDTKLFIGDGAESDFGDRDDVMVSTELANNAYGGWNEIWKRSA